MSPRQPVLFLSHGAPPLADDATWTGQLHDWSSRLDKPTSVLMVSAHWENQPVTVSSTRPGTPLVYDFWGFPQKYYDVIYDAPVAPELASRVAGLVDGPVYQGPDRGLDHGAYVPMVELFPEADVPVVQMSLPTLDPKGLYELGRRLTPLRDEGTLIIGSGFTTHNLRWFNPFVRDQLLTAIRDISNGIARGYGLADTLTDDSKRRAGVAAAWVEQLTTALG